MQSLILQCAVRALLIAICIGAVLFALRVKSARVRHAVWASAVVWMLVLPVWTAWGPRAVLRVMDPVTAPSPSRAASSVEALPTQTATTPVGRPVWNWQGWLAAIYLLGAFALLARLATGTVRAHMLVMRAVRCAGHGPAPLTSEVCAAPITVGWLHPTVILPAHWRQWPEAQLRAVMEHEGEHARWRDPLVQWLALLNRAIFWFHPLAWWLERQLSALSEEACDSAVLSRGHDPFEYSEYLLEIARAMQRGAQVNVMGMAMPGPFLPQRIRRILERRPIQQISRARVVCVALACAVASAIFTAGAMERSQIVANSEPQIRSLTVAAPFAVEPSPRAPARKPRVLLAQAQASPAAAPQGAGPISGTVQDPSGARVPDCLVVVHDQSGADVQSVRSDPVGHYQFSPLPPGHYTVEFQMRGFSKLKQDAEIEAGKAARIDAMLSIGNAYQTLTVIGRKPVAAPATPSAEQPVSEPGRISVGGRVESAKLLRHPEPIYPPELKQQGIEGTVHLATIISSDGVPVELKVLNADQVDPRLIQAALDAVRLWRYLPTKLNEHPVATSTNIDVIFELDK